MQDDNPLWYDYAEPDVAPSRTMSVFANLLSVSSSAVVTILQLHKMPGRLWQKLACRFGQRQEAETKPL